MDDNPIPDHGIDEDDVLAANGVGGAAGKTASQAGDEDGMDDSDVPTEVGGGSDDEEVEEDDEDNEMEMDEDMEVGANALGGSQSEVI